MKGTEFNMKRYKIAALALCAVMALSACGTEYVGNVGSRKISRAEYEFYLSSVKSQMSGTELSSDEDWNTKEIEGKKAIDLAKERAFDTAAENLMYIEVAEKLGIKLTDEEEKILKQYKQMLVKNYGGQEAYNAFLKEQGIDDKFIDMMCKSMGYTDKLIEKVAEEEPSTDAEKEEYFKNHYRRAKHVLVMTIDQTTQIPFDDAKKAEAKKKADEILARAQNGEDFDALINEFNEDPGMKSNPDGYVFTDGEMVQEFTDGVDSLETGEITMAETSYGYHIIKRYAIDETPEYFKTAFESKKSNVEYAMNKEKLDAKMDTWCKELGIEIKKKDNI